MTMELEHRKSIINLLTVTILEQQQKLTLVKAKG
jgi:hypothetical protein